MINAKRLQCRTPSCSQRRRHAQDTHPAKRTNHAQVPTMRQIQRLRKQLQRNTCHDTRSNSEHPTIHPLARCPVALAGKFKPYSRDSSTYRLAQTAKDERNPHGFYPRVDSKVEWERQGEAFSDIVDEEGEEDGHAEGWVRVVRGVGDEAFGEFVERDGDGGLEADGEEGVGGDVVVVFVWVV